MNKPGYCIQCSQPVSEGAYATSSGGISLFYCNNEECSRYALASYKYRITPRGNNEPPKTRRERTSDASNKSQAGKGE